MREVLVATYGAEAPAPDAYEWWSFGCPEAASGFMVAEVSGRVVGVQPMELFPYTFDREAYRGGVLTGVAVHPGFRRQGIFLALVQACEREAWRQGADFVTTMPNERSRPGFLKMGYLDPGRRRLLVRPLAPQALVKRVLRRRLPASVLGAMVMAGQRLLKPAPCPVTESFREAAGLPEGIEELTKAHARLFPGLRMRRSRAWWQWRYERSPTRSYRFFEKQDGAGGTSGAAVVAAETRDGVAVAYLMDVAVREPGVFPDLLGGVFEATRLGGAQLLCAIASSGAMIRALRRAGFWLVPAWVPVKRFYSVVRFNPDREAGLPAACRSILHWDQMLGDWDNL